MREIEFRAWDELGKFMISNDELIRRDFNILCEWEYFKKMQYTGLKDKNGVKIFEGDIVRCITESGFMETSEYISIVEYPEDDSCFFLKVKSVKTVTKNGGGLLIKTLSKNYWTTLKHHANEVIGNIYENKELLGENNASF